MQNRVVCLYRRGESCWLAHEQGSEAGQDLNTRYSVEARGGREGGREGKL